MDDPPLRPRKDGPALAARLASSARRTGDGRDMATADVPGWLADRAAANRFTVHRVAFKDLDGWSFAESTGNLVHSTGRFFSVEGLSVRSDDAHFRYWQQPIIRQPESGILGILVKEFDGVLHFLMQAKMEPGNRNIVQVSPTVQATRSNYLKVHRGTGVKYLDYFVDSDKGRVLTDTLQSEHGSWFFRKKNRNMLVEAIGDVPEDDDFRWLTLGQIGELLRLDNVVNMDARTVIACLPMDLDGSGARALHSDAELLAWISAERSQREVEAELLPLAEVEGWERGEHVLRRPDGRYFQVVAVSVEAGNREVAAWSQPLFEPTGTGVTAFVFRSFGGAPHVLVHARAEPGFLDTVELGPTVQCTPENWAPVPDSARPRFLDLVASRGRVPYKALHSEEGGRFLNAESDYLFVEADGHEAPLQAPPGYTWVTPGQLNSLAAHSHYLNVQCRTLLAALNSGALRLDEPASG
ncbi:NDP-hexose 2,3-dehydratase [Streptomonospora sp. PA3]|nr:NDP-hexose 2,3-dehydratase [Streptomonospora sp. PA3]